MIAVAGIVVEGAKAGGFGLGDALSWDVVSSVLETRFGKVWAAQAGLAAAVAMLLAARKRVLALAPAALLLLTPSASGHASVSGGLALVTDVAHVTAAAVWVGGLAALVLALLWAARSGGSSRSARSLASRGSPSSRSRG